MTVVFIRRGFVACLEICHKPQSRFFGRLSVRVSSTSRSLSEVRLSPCECSLIYESLSPKGAAILGAHFEFDCVENLEEGRDVEGCRLFW